MAFEISDIQEDETGGLARQANQKVTMLHFLEDRYVEFLRNHRSITVLRLDHRWHVYRATC